MEQLTYHVDAKSSTPLDTPRINRLSDIAEFQLQHEFRSNMVEKESRHQAAVPFLWEEKPGTPKKDWKPLITLEDTVPSPPIKLVASVPFGWEETPGKPLPCFPELEQEMELLNLQPAKLDPLRSPSICSDDLFDLDLKAFQPPTMEVPLPGAVPVQKTSLGQDSKGRSETPSSPDSESDSGGTSSFATNLAGASILECLFPLFAIDSSSGHNQKGSSLLSTEQQKKDLECNGNSSSIVRRRAPTLGELIQMSQKRSYHMKAVKMRKQEEPSTVSPLVLFPSLIVIACWSYIWNSPI